MIEFSAHFRLRRTWARPFGCCLALVALSVTMASATVVLSARAGDITPARVAIVDGSGVLDGQVFSGEFGAVGKPARGTDGWIFENGTFMSKECEKCGFPRGVYRTRRDGDKISFVAETPCPRTDARLVWRGTIENGRIEGVYTWTKRRWYRTIRKDFWFKGKLSSNEQAATAHSPVSNE